MPLGQIKHLRVLCVLIVIVKIKRGCETHLGCRCRTEAPAGRPRILQLDGADVSLAVNISEIVFRGKRIRAGHRVISVGSLRFLVFPILPIAR